MAVLESDRTSSFGTVGYGAVLLAVGLGFAAMTPKWGFMSGMGALFFVACAVAVLVSAFRFRGRGPCTYCGEMMVSVPRDGYHPCVCGEYNLVRDKVIEPIGADHIAPVPTFQIALGPESAPLVDLCAACGQVATHTASKEVSKTVVGVPGVTPSLSKRWRLEVPFCDVHGREITAQPEAPWRSVHWYDGKLFVRSHRFWRAVTGMTSRPLLFDPRYPSGAHGSVTAPDVDRA